MKPIPHVIVLDTCVLLPNVLRQGLLHLARLGCFTPVWSTVIGDEWRRNAARLWDISDAEVLIQWEALQQAWPASDLGDVAGYKEGLSRSDPKDWHVIAAASKVKSCGRGEARVAIITRNVRDFHRAELYHLGVELLDPDALMLRCLENAPQAMRRALDAFPAHAAEHGREIEPLGLILRRERLFRLNKRLHANGWLTEEGVSTLRATTEEAPPSSQAVSVVAEQTGQSS
ncbi:PIN domain-containing protein [Allopusillimonas ginsengisoli]|uniref:PIN domain-containing protein n=1 Tax=Allopusillimonas ginsengisoli TaxID=453575 RepID=UPI001FD697E8|nr:PIN domain-containing protein [Allopusillimonas ginsengisoli]